MSIILKKKSHIIGAITTTRAKFIHRLCQHFSKSQDLTLKSFIHNTPGSCYKTGTLGLNIVDYSLMTSSLAQELLEKVESQALAQIYRIRIFIMQELQAVQMCF